MYEEDPGDEVATCVGLKRVRVNKNELQSVLNINVLINPVLPEGLVSELLVDACMSFNKYDRNMVD
jgi:hypothetical protein